MTSSSTFFLLRINGAGTFNVNHGVIIDLSDLKFPNYCYDVIYMNINTDYRTIAYRKDDGLKACCFKRVSMYIYI